MTLMRIVDTVGHPGGSSGTDLTYTDHTMAGPLRHDPYIAYKPWGSEAAIFLRQSDSACWTSSRLDQSDLQLSADTVIAYPATWRGDSASWQAVLLVASGFTLVPA